MASILKLMRRALAPMRPRPRPPSPPRTPSTRPFQLIESTQKLEEETLSTYRPFNFYPARIGEIFRAQYQIVAKLGYGAYSTVWFCRDLQQHRYVALKVYIRTSAFGTHAQREIEVYQRMSRHESSHPGRKSVRTILDHFDVYGPDGHHHCLVHTPLSMKLPQLLSYLPDRRFTVSMLRPFCVYMLHALDYLHAEVGVIHADIKPGNILLENRDEDVFAEMEDMEAESPSDRKVIDEERIIYRSRLMPRPKKWGAPILCDFGEARFADRTHDDDIQPEVYRAPEVILHMHWDSKVDIWNLGVMLWDLFEGKHLFESRDAEGRLDNALQLSQMVAYFGRPPQKLLQKGGDSELFFDTDGNLKNMEIPALSLETAEGNLQGEEQALFLNFMRKMLCWLPEERKTAKELLNDPWLASSVR